MQTSDGGYIAIGHGIESSGADDMLIIKIDENGNLEWQQDFGTAGKLGTGYCIAEAPDGYIAGGGIYETSTQRTQRFLAKLDLTGNIVWEKYYTAAGIGGIRGIDLTSDGGIVVTGYINTPNVEEFQGFVFIVDEGDGFIMKLDAEGNTEWARNIEAPQGTKVREIDGGYAVCSSVWNWTPETGDQQDFCLIETDDQGNTVSRHCYGGDRGEHLYDFDLTEDGGYILAGHTQSYGVTNWDYLLMKIDADGNKEWHKTFGQPRGYDARYIHDEAYGVRQTSDGGYIIAGGSGDEYSYSASGHPAGPSDEWKAYLVKTDASGNVQWEGVYPPTSVANNAAEYIGLTSDGGYIVFVDTDSQSPPDPNNYGFLKLAPDEVTAPINQEFPTFYEYQLFPNYPNPFNSSTSVRYSLASTSHVMVNIYNLLGHHVTTLVNRTQTRGDYSITWNAKTALSGVYFYHIKAGQYEEMGKMLVLE